MKEKFNKKNINWVLFFWFFLVLIFFYEVIFFEKCFIGGDAAMASYPSGYFISQCIKNKEFPLWNPYIFFGYPIFAEGLDGIVYPLNILFLFLPYYLQDNYSVVLHFFLSGFFMMIFISLFIRDKIIQLLGAILWVFSGVFIYRITHFSVILSLTYLPLFFYLIERFIREEKIIFLIILAPIITFEILIGHTQIFVYTLFVLILYYIFRKIELKQKILNYKILILGAFVLLGILMGAVQLLPTLDLISISVRGGGLEKQAILSSEKINFINLINIIYPYIFGSTHNNTFFGYNILGTWSMSYIGIYTGAISFLMFIISIKIYRQYKIIIFLWTLIFFTILFSFGSNFPINNFILNLPGINFFRNPIKMLALYSFFMVFLTTYIFYNMDISSIPQKLFKMLFYFAVFIIIITFIFIIFQNSIIASKTVQIENFIENKFLNSSYHHYNYEYYFNKFKNTISFVLNHILQQTFFLGLYIFLLLLFAEKKLSKQKLVLIILPLIILEMFINGMFYNRVVDKEYVTESPKVVNFFKKEDNKFFRVLQWRFFENEKEVFKSGRANGTLDEFLLSKEILQPNTNVIYEIFSYWGYSPLAYKKYCEFFSEIDSGTLKGGKEADDLFCKGFNTLIISGVKFILSPYKINCNKIKEIGKVENIHIYKNERTNEFVKFFTDIFYVNDDKKILQLIKGGEIDFNRRVLIKNTEMSDINMGKAVTEIKILKWGNGKIEFEINTDKDGVAVISNYFDSEKQNKDWIAYVDGRKTNILNANYIFMGLKINKGFHRVKIIYSPYFFKVGLIISLIVLIFYIGFSFMLLKVKAL